MISFLIKVVIVLAGTWIYTYFYPNYFQTITRMNTDSMALLLPVAMLIPLLTGLLVELVPFNRKIKPSWKHFLVLIVVLGVVYFCSSPFSIELLGLGSVMKWNWGLPMLSVFIGLLLGKALVGEVTGTQMYQGQFCSQCRIINESSAEFCVICGSKLKGGKDHLIGNNEELHHYLLTASGISRFWLNIMCFIGIFIFGWLLAVVFIFLGKKGTGWLYVITVIVLLVISQQAAPEFFPIALIIYLIGWVHANLVLSRYESLARQRIAEIDRKPAGEEMANTLLERGVLKLKILRKTEEAMADFEKASQLPDANPWMLNIAGVAYTDNHRFREAKQFFDRALETANEEILVKQIKQNQAIAEKHLK